MPQFRNSEHYYGKRYKIKSCVIDKREAGFQNKPARLTENYKGEQAR